MPDWLSNLLGNLALLVLGFFPLAASIAFGVHVGLALGARLIGPITITQIWRKDGEQP